MCDMASKEANRAKYLYNKKYQEAYWERKAQQAAESETAQTEQKRLSKRVTTTVEEYFKDDEVQTLSTPITRSKDMSDDKWMKYLEDCCKSLHSENKRLVRLLQKYQEVVSLGLETLSYRLK